MAAWITNWCTNPSFEAGLSGWSALGGTVLSQDATFVAFGQQALKVVTDGAQAGEGFYGPVVPVGGTDVPCSVSLSLFSVTGGTVTVSAVSGSSGAVLATATIQMTSDWVRAQVSGFTVTARDSFQIVVQTPTAQALTFRADAAQMEIGVTTASAYVDGDQPGCSWLGTPKLSASQQPYQHTVTASGGMLLSGSATPVQRGQKLTVTASGSMTMTGDAAPTSAAPVAAFDDFALFELTDPDPAMTFCDQNNAGTNSGHTTYAQNYGVFYPPLDYPVSGGKYAWRRAAYMAMGLKFSSVAAGQEQNISMAQVSLAPITGSPAVPLAYTPPRQIQTIIKPTRLNYCTNPSFEVSTAGWAGVATGTIAQDTTTAVPQPGWLTIAQAGALPPDFNSVAVSTDKSTGTGNFDGTGYSYSAQALAAAGIVPGNTIISGGISFIFPNAGAGQADNIAATGQVIPVPAPPGATVIAFLGAAANGGMSGVSGTVTITYTDGTTSSATLGFSDWTLDAGAATPGYSNQIAATLPYRNKQDGTTSTVTSYLFTQTIAANPAKAIASITLPNAPNLHIFAVSLAEASATMTGTATGKVTVNASGDGASFSVPNLIIGDTYAASVYLQAGAGLTSITAVCGNGTASISEYTGGVPYGGEPGIGFGQGPYGGVDGGPPYGGTDGTSYGAGDYGGAPNNLPTGVWYRLSFSFVAQASTQALNITALPSNTTVLPTSFWIDQVLVEPGTQLQPYFDGSYGAANYLDYQWEGTAGLSRSYYYPQLAVKKYTVAQILAKHTPIGITAAAPAYLTPSTQ